MTRPTLLCLGLAALAASCSRPRARRTQPADAGALSTTRPAHHPSTLSVDRYAGAAACAECHAEIYGRWKASPHGRAMAVATADNILALPGSIAIAGGSAGAEPAARKITLTPAGAAASVHTIDLVLGAGRQHQEYLTRTGPEHYTLLPMFWSEKTRVWLPLALYQPGSLVPDAADHWSRATPETSRCPACHMSQAHHTYEDGRLHLRWVDLPINCESCHGPAAEHARRQVPMKKLNAMGNREEAEVCGRCHIARMSMRFADDGARGSSFGMTLAFDQLRIDGTQRLPTYQLPGHLTSPCFLDGAMTCSGCHDPHTQHARAQHTRASAEGTASNLQCTGCHPELADARVASAHSHHQTPAGAAVRCVDCHMSRSWIGDDPARAQETSDHSISIPRPAEARAYGLPNACLGCHQKPPAWAEKALAKWGAKRALGVRPWLRAIAAGRARDAGATELLLAVLADGKVGDYVHASALELLAAQPPAPAQVLPTLERFLASEQPLLRAHALLAGRAHDPENPGKWRTAALADPHPVVRIKAFESEPALHEVPNPDLERLAVDYLTHSDLFPYGGIETIGKIYASRGDRERARALFETTCAEGPAIACRWAAAAHARSPLSDPARAAAFSKRACERGDAQSCITGR